MAARQTLRLLLLLFFYLNFYFIEINNAQAQTQAPTQRDARCPPPPVPLNARVTISNASLTAGTTAQFTCDDGYNLFGSATLTCGGNGAWAGEKAICAVNVAYRKPANQSTWVRGGEATNANDGDLTTLHDGRYCTETRREVSPWWRVDLLRTYEIQTVRILTRKCCGKFQVQDLEIRVGNNTVLQKNKLCAWHPGGLEDGSVKDFQCARPEIARYVFIQLVGVEGSLSLCEVQVFTTQEFSHARCSNASDPSDVAAFSQTCYEFQLKKGSNFQKARDYCKSRGGDLANRITNVTQHFLAGELERLRAQMTPALLWIGVTRDPGMKARTWRWITGEDVSKPLWGEDQPNNYNGEQNCAVFDGGRGWLWNDVGCNLDYLLTVCQYIPSTCGSPDVNLNTTVTIVSPAIGGAVTYSCPEDSFVVGDANRTCLPTGFWSGHAPNCKYVQCGPPEKIEMGEVKLRDNRTTYGARAIYTCPENHALEGPEVRTCSSNGRWNGSAPTCMVNTCPDPLQMLNATVHVTGTHAGDNATYSCNKGHQLIGEANLTCLLGGRWSSDTPVCKYVDCGLPPPLNSGNFFLPDNTTTYGSHMTYRCTDNHVLRGVMERRCGADGQWTGEEPSCEIISCGEPDVFMGSYVVGYEFTVGSLVEYFCDPGYVMEGTINRTCEPNGNWTGKAPKCRYVDCNRVQPIPYAVLNYVNDTTHVGSLVTYDCTSSYSLIGSSPRVCQLDGKWSGSTPSCQEIRCPEPKRPLNSVVSVSGNDRSGTGDTFKIGSTVQYRCEKGFILEGDSLHTCQASGEWNSPPPKCKYVDCLLPEKIAYGTFQLPVNATFFGSPAMYKCDENYELVGESERKCLDTGQWSGVVPSCQEITCGPPDRPPSIESIEVGQFVGGSVATYKCSRGQRLTGNGTRVCTPTGRWSGSAPECKWVDCERPRAVENGRSYLAEQSTTYNSTVEYHCFPGYQLLGPKKRVCQEDSTWNGTEPTCELDGGSNSVETRDSSARQDEDVSSARSVGIAIGVGSGVLLLVVIGVALLYMRTRVPKPLYSSDGPKDNGTVVTYAVRADGVGVGESRS